MARLTKKRKIKSVPKNEERDQLLLDLFHRLSQPLASLHCWLELLGKSRRLGSGLIKEVHQARECVEQITWPLSLMRELMVPTDQDGVELILISELLQDLREELAPVAESRGVSLAYRPSDVGKVAFPRNKLRELVFRVLESMIGCAHAGDHVLITARKRNGEIRLSIAVFQKDVAKGVSSELPWVEARKVLLNRVAICRTRECAEAVGGSLRTAQGKRLRKIIVALPCKRER